MTVTALPPNGTVLLADGFTPVRLQQALTLAELSALKFKPALSSAAGSRCSGSSTTGQVRSVVDDEAWLSAGYSILSVPPHSGARTIGIQICNGADSAASESYAIITGLPSNGTVLLADGATSVVQGQTLTAAQLRRLRFKPAVAAVGQISNLGFLMVHAAGSAAGCSLLIVHPAAPVTARSAPTPVTAAEGSIAVAAGAAAPFDTYLSSMPASKQIPPVLQTEEDGRKREKRALPSSADTQARGRAAMVKRAAFSTGSAAAKCLI
jgi:hypothetical protein